MMEIKEIKDKVSKLYSEKKEIHISINSKRKKVKDATCVIDGVYNNFFVVKSMVNRYEESFTVLYVDVYSKNTIIKELTE